MFEDNSCAILCLPLHNTIYSCCCIPMSLKYALCSYSIWQWQVFWKSSDDDPTSASNSRRWHTSYQAKRFTSCCQSQIGEYISSYCGNSCQLKLNGNNASLWIYQRSSERSPWLNDWTVTWRLDEMAFAPISNSWCNILHCCPSRPVSTANSERMY